FDGSPIVSVPSNVIEPRRRPTMPMIDFSVVVFPAPLRPSSVTVSPARTSKSTPYSTCDSPYHACRSRTTKRAGSRASPRPLSPASAARGDLDTRPHVRFDDLWIARDRRVVAFGEDLAAREHGDGRAEILDDAEVVLDHQHGAV